MEKKKLISKVDLVMIMAILGVLAWILLPAILKARESERRSACVNNLKGIGSALYTYSNENDGKFPPVDFIKNNFIFESDVLYPKYLADASLLACPSDPENDPNANFRLISDHPTDGTSAGQVHPDCITDKSYVYLGWVVMSDEEAEALFKAYDKLSPEDYDKNIIVPEGRGTLDGSVLHRFSVGVEKFTYTNINWAGSREVGASTVPIMWERPYTDPKKNSHQYGDIGVGNVLYLDGHVECIRFGEFPMTETIARLLEERPREPIPDCEE